jgi:IS5 family transposase
LLSFNDGGINNVDPPIMMFKILILQAWYALSDEALEKQIARDLMFRRYAKVSILG